MRIPIAPMCAALVSFASPGWAAPTETVPLSGYACAMLNLPPDLMRDPSYDVPILTGPSASSPKLGSAASIVFEKSPAHVENGYAEVRFPDGRRGWIAARLLRPAPFSCSPVQTPDGKVRIGR